MFTKTNNALSNYMKHGKIRDDKIRWSLVSVVSCFVTYFTKLLLSNVVNLFLYSISLYSTKFLFRNLLLIRHLIPYYDSQERYDITTFNERYDITFLKNNWHTRVAYILLKLIGIGNWHIIPTSTTFLVFVATLSYSNFS